jgi:cytochrome P450/ubiquinone/menaquinone biosynthesis C-methylase UbiE
MAYPPGPRSRVPGRLELAFLRNPTDFLIELSSYGDLAYFKFRDADIYLVSDPEKIKQVLAADHRGFVKSQSMQESRRVLGNGLLTSEGDYHHRQRRLVQPGFHKDRVAAMGGAMVEIADSTAAAWQQRQEIDMHVEMSKLTVRIVAETLFSTNVDRRAEEIVFALAKSITILARLPLPLAHTWERLPLPSSRRFARSLEVLRQATNRIVQERKASTERRDDVLGLLLDAQSNGAGLTDEQVRDETITLLLAGHETTANALTWAWYLLSQHPDVEQKLHAEIEAVLGDRPPTVADLEAMPYGEKVFLETLRLYPPVWAMGRRATEDYEIDDYTVPAGSIVAINQYVMHHDARFFANPFAFDPERWTDEERATRPRYSFFPFGGGPRLCVGAGFAMMEGRLVLAALARHWRFRLAPGHSVRTAPQLTLRPKHGMRMTLEARTAPRVERQNGSAAYWDAATSIWQHSKGQRLWRAHSDAVGVGLVEAWLPGDLERVLKTDLWDEAVGTGLIPELSRKANEVIAVDVSEAVVEAARARYPELSAQQADVRRLPFEDGWFDAVVSNSTLDHFESENEIRAAIWELRRVLRPGGTLVLTLDNPRNPLVATTKLLPRARLNRFWLKHARTGANLGLLPYHVGATVGPSRLRRWLSRADFDIEELEETVHCPRLPAVLLGALLERRGTPRAQERLRRALAGFEKLRGTWASPVTGQFVAVLARRR